MKEFRTAVDNKRTCSAMVRVYAAYRTSNTIATIIIEHIFNKTNEAIDSLLILSFVFVSDHESCFSTQQDIICCPGMTTIPTAREFFTSPSAKFTSSAP